MRQRVAQVTRVAVEVVVVAAVRLVDDDDDVAPGREEGVAVAGFAFVTAAPEFLQGREVDPAGCPAGQFKKGMTMSDDKTPAPAGWYPGPNGGQRYWTAPGGWTSLVPAPSTARSAESGRSRS
ncbi:hypothetical protein RAJCM14343_3908 [Rhodococcus aetherivorans]|uniref:DUF2510 domain-containing protein n=1 Tax=Rhodococcus aetherivorans TaxID=191292 RepID=A0ABQ0YPX2_9NOCA|nr:hypothetical protein RAJCM14343_3908 [Rhodococcus aetherivorans]